MRFNRNRRGAALADELSVLKVSSSNPSLPTFFCFLAFEF